MEYVWATARTGPPIGRGTHVVAESGPAIGCRRRAQLQKLDLADYAENPADSICLTSFTYFAGGKPMKTLVQMSLVLGDTSSGPVDRELLAPPS